jgi:hypothetical protein
MATITSAERIAGNKEASRKGSSLNRKVHRIGGFLASLLMLWLAITGSMVQLLDFKAILSHAPATDPTELSMAEGMYGPGDFPVIQLSDFSAAALPRGFEINDGIRTVLQAVHTQQGQGVSAGTEQGDSQAARPTSSGQPDPMAWVELRMEDGIPIGQVMMGTKLEAFDATTGERVTPVPPKLIPQGRRLPPSLRQRLKTLHRFWNRGDTPGVYFEMLSGFILWFLLITGMVMYFRLLKARVQQGRSQLLWLSSGNLWRGLHRVVSLIVAVFLLCVAFSGTWLGFESSVNALRRRGGGPPPPAAVQQKQSGQPTGDGVTRRNPVDFIVPLRDGEVQEMAASTVAAMRRLHPDTPIKAIRLRVYGQMKQGVVITGGDRTDQVVFNADTRQPAGLSEPTYPESGFPFGVQVHENIKHFHSGAMFGIPTRLMSLFAGFSLTFLAVSGLVMYFDMWFKRRKAGLNSLIWF